MSFTAKKLAPYMLLAASGISACATSPNDGTVYTPSEAGRKAESQVRQFNAACAFIPNRDLKRACYNQVKESARQARIDAQAEAATQGSCNQRNSTDRQARRDNTDGTIIYDETTQNRSEDCKNRAPNSGNGQGTKPIFK